MDEAAADVKATGAPAAPDVLDARRGAAPAGAASARPEGDPPRFVIGSTMRHVVVMTATASVGLVAVFAVDLLSLLYVSWLGDPRLTAGVGLATIVLFFATSINVGLMIAVGALVSRALGAREREEARRLAASSLSHMALASTVVAVVLLPLLPILLPLLGASPETLPAAERFLWITLPSNTLMALGMGFSGVLRAVGDAKRAMYVTLVGAVVTAGLDPLLIFGLKLGVDGAAVATVISRLIFAAGRLPGRGRGARPRGAPAPARRPRRCARDLRHRAPRRSHQRRDAGRQRLPGRRARPLRGRGDRRQRHRRPAGAGGLRRHLRALRRRRPHPRPELGRRPLRPHAAGAP
jgi:hypothetical protein